MANLEPLDEADMKALSTSSLEPLTEDDVKSLEAPSDSPDPSSLRGKIHEGLSTASEKLSEYSKFTPSPVVTEALANALGIGADLANPATTKAQVAESAIRGAAQTATGGYFDEASARLDSMLTDRTYDDALKDYRGRDARSREEAPFAHKGGGVAMNVAMAPITGAMSPVKQGLLGAADAFGRSEADLSTSEGKKDALLETLLGGTLSYGLTKAPEVLDKKYATSDFKKALMDRVAKAEGRAASMGAEKSAEESLSKIRKAGGETVHASNIAKTLTMLPDTPNAPVAPGPYADYLEGAAAKALKKAEDAEQLALAGNVGDSPLTIDPEFAPRAGSALAKARDARMEAEYHRKTAEDLARRAKEIRETGVVPERSLPTKEEISQLPEFIETTANVKENMLSDLKGEAERSRAAREFAKQVKADEPARAARYTEELLSPKAFLKGPVMDRVLRHGPALVGTAVGSMFGGTLGAMAGGGAGVLAGQGLSKAAGALAGAGARPALQSMGRLVTKYPFAQKLIAGGTDAAITSSLAKMGKYAAPLTRALADSPDRYTAMLGYFMQNDPEFEKQLEAAQQTEGDVP